MARPIWSILLAALAAAVPVAAVRVAGAPPPPLLVSVAASLGDVLSDVARRYEQQTGQRVSLNVGGSNFLARQIVEGARADVFVSADDAQMDVAERAGRLVPGSRVALLTNQLVVVGAPGSSIRIGGAKDLAAPAVRRLALGNPESVPAGVYARRWLEGAGVWPSVASRVVPTVTVRAALAAVRSARADAAVVYLTDARTEPAVPVLFRVPASEAPPIQNPAALVVGRQQDDASRFLAFLQEPDARAVFLAAGFGVPAR
jgi:molybdate transport system substrate-binding protein